MEDLAVLLVAYVLAYGIGHADAVLLQLQHAEGNAVDVDHEVGPPVLHVVDVAAHRHLLGHAEVVALGVLPVDVAGLPAERAVLLMHLRGIAQVVVNGLVLVVEVLHVGAHRVGLQFVDGLLGLLHCAMLPANEKFLQLILQDVAVLLFLEVAQVLIAVHIVEQTDDFVLHLPLGVHDCIE